MYSDPISCVLNGGYTGEYFSLARSTRQGDPSSARIFALVVEILGIKIRTNATIKGIEISNYEILTAQYADDLWTLLEPSEDNINNLLYELEKFKRFSGLDINVDKSVAMLIGPMRDTDAKFYTQKQLFWSKGAIKILGITIYNDAEVTCNVNYMDVLTKVENILKSWQHRKLSLLGKIKMINSLMTTQFLYKFMVLPSPDEFFFRFYKRLILDFLWEGGAPRIRYNKLIQRYEEGGLKLADLEAKNWAIKTKWVEYLSNKEAPWFDVNVRSIKKAQDIWKCNMKEDVDKLVKRLPYGMINEIVKAWVKINYKYPQESIDMMQSYLWLNSDIRRGQKPFSDRFT